MATEAEAARVWDRLRCAYPHVGVLEGELRITEPQTPEHIRADVIAFVAVYNDLPYYDALASFNRDREFLKNILVRTAELLAQETLAKMFSIRRNIWHRYLTGGEQGERQAAIDQNVTWFARALASWLVFTSDAPYPALLEDEPSWRNTELGAPDLPSLDWEIRADEDADIETTGEERRPAWRRWGAISNPAQRFARYALGRGSDDLRGRLLAPENSPVYGHSILQLVGKFRTPGEVYQILKLDRGPRTIELRRLIREIEQFLLGGEREFERARRNRDWVTLRPLLDAAKWYLFPDGPNSNPRRPRRDAPLHHLIDYIIEHDSVLDPWTLRDWLFAGTLVVSIALALFTFGASTPATIGALTAIDIALGIAGSAVDVYLAALDNEERRRINRFAAIDHQLGNIAERPESLTTTVAFNVLSLLLPIAVARGGRALARSRFMQRVLEPITAPQLEQRAAQQVANQARRGRRAVNRPPSGRPPRPSEQVIPSQVPQQQPGQVAAPTASPPGQVTSSPAVGTEVVSGGGPRPRPEVEPVAQAVGGDAPPPPPVPPPEAPPRPVEPPDARRTGVDETPASRSLDVPEVPSSRLRPPPGYSEQYVHQYLQRSFPSGTWEEQIVFLNGRRWTGQPGARLPRNSTRPESYNELLGIAVEVKNWDQAMNYHEMIRNIMGQQGGRAISLPPGTRQWLFVDVRMQRLTDFDGMARSIRRDLGGTQIFERIHLITDGGVLTYR